MNLEQLQTTPKGFLVLCAIGCPSKKVEVSDAEQASAIWSQYRDTFGFGMSSLKRTSGNLVDANGKVIGRVSYNGNIFDQEGNMIWGKTFAERCAQ